jgi:hypothetical protein
VKVCRNLALVLLPLALLAAGCHDRLLGQQSDVVVLNQSSCDLTVSIDGWDAVTVASGSTLVVDNVGSGRHVLEARDRAGRLVQRRYLELASGESFSWSVASCQP